MKNLLKLFGTQRHRLCAIAIAAVIGFSLVSCGGSSPSDDDPPEPSGVATLSGITVKGIAAVSLGTPHATLGSETPGRFPFSRRIPELPAGPQPTRTRP